MMNLIIRLEQPKDQRAVEELIREAFWNVYRPGCAEHYLMHRLRESEIFIPELNVVMERNGELIGQNCFSKTIIHADDGRTIPVLTMGPISIAPAYKRQGYGQILLNETLNAAAKLGYGAIFFEGNYHFYQHGGLRYASEFGIRYPGLPEGVEADFFLGKELQPGYLDGVTGEYVPPLEDFCEPDQVEEFDKSFPPKEKLKLPGQLV